MKPIAKTQSLEVLARVAVALRELLGEVVFVGGSAGDYMGSHGMEDIQAAREMDRPMLDTSRYKRVQTSTVV